MQLTIITLVLIMTGALTKARVFNRYEMIQLCVLNCEGGGRELHYNRKKRNTSSTIDDNITAFVSMFRRLVRELGNSRYDEFL